MKSTTVNISFQKDLLEQIDKVAKEEARSRSELIREAARTYLERKTRWKKIFEYGEKVAREKKLIEADIEKEIAAVRMDRKKLKN